MLGNYYKTAFRSWAKGRTYMLLNLAGLALGIAAFLFITAFVRSEYSFDQGHRFGERIYRVESLFFKGGQKTDHWATSTNGYAPAMAANFPEIEAFTRINWNNSTRVVRYQDVKFRELRVSFADSNFFTFFAYPVLKGDPATFLNAPNTVVISESAADRYFGNADPLGKYLDLSTVAISLHCQVTGVFKDLPDNSTMQFDILMSWQTSPPRMRNFWYQHGSYTFVRLRPGADPEKVEARFPALADRYKTAEALKDHTWAIDLVPLQDIHLNPAKPHELETKGNRKAVQLLAVMALVILATALINFTNLSTAKAIDRAREVGVRKAAGAHKGALVFQFLFESMLFNGAALLVALLLVLLAGRVLPGYLGLRIPAVAWADPLLYGLLPVIFASGTLLSGLYPALILSRMEPVRALKGNYSFSSGGVLMRKGLVIFQFTASMVLIVGTYIVYRQLHYMTSQPLGVNTDQILVLESPVKTEDYYQKAEAFKNEIKSLPGVLAVTGSGAVPGKEVGKFLANRRLHESPEADRLYEMLPVDYDFVTTYGLQMVAGRDFDRSRPTDQYGLILNQTALRQFGFRSASEAIGQKVLLEANPGRSNEIIGVIGDYHHQSLEQPYKPTILFMDPDFRWIPTAYYSIKINAENIPELTDKLTGIWNRFFPESSLDYFFLDQFFNQQYSQDRQFGRTFLIFSSLAIWIACLGLLGLTFYTTARRTKEICIRKVVGATVTGIISMLAWDTLKLVLMGGMVAIPVSWYVMSKWLEGYAFRIPLQAVHWLLPLGIMVLIAWLTIGYLTIRAAFTNPATTLRSE